MTTHCDAPIEALSDISWQRIENGLFERLDHELALDSVAHPIGSARRRWLAGAAVIAAAAAVVLFFALGGDDGPSQRSAGVDDVAHATTAPSRIVTTDAPSRYSVADASITIAPESAILVTKDAQDSVLIVLERGEIDCKVPPRRARQTFAIQAGSVRIEVIGTSFAAFRHGEDVRVEVTEGTVLIVSGGQRSSVSAGQSWPAGKAETAPKEPKRADRSKPRKRRVAETPTPTAKERYRAALRLQSTDPRAAAAIFVELAKHGGPWGRNALFAHAELEIERGRTAAAKRLLRTYIRKHPRGPNADDARELLSTLN